MYDPTLGQFVSRDPIAADENLYRYCGSNSVTNVDPSGLADETARINLWMGDTRDSKPGLNAFYKANVDKECVWFGVIGCGKYGPGGKKRLSLPPIPGEQRIPGVPDCGGPGGVLSYDDAPQAASDALAAAKVLKKKLLDDEISTKVDISIQMTTTFKNVLKKSKEGPKVLKELNPYLK